MEAWFKSGLRLRGGWGRRPKGNVPRSEASALGVAGCCQLDPSHPTIVTCAVGREGRHAPRPNDVGGQPRFPGARQGVTLPLLVIFGLATGPPAGVGDGLRFIPLHALTTLLSALGAFCLWEFRVSQQISTFYGSSVQAMEIRLARGSDGGPRRFTAVVPTPHAYSGQWPVKTKRARARSCASVVTRKRPSLNRAEKTSESLLERNCSAVGKTAKSLLPTPSTTRAIRPGSTSP